MTRGVVLPLTLAQVAARARYLAGWTATLDPHVRAPAERIADGYYLLKEHNGGKDPTAPDPWDRWSKPGSTFQNVTADCIGGAAWCGGFDRYQPQRFAHIYSGWINTDSMIMDARGPAKCFVELERPEPGCFVVAASGSRGHAIGHIGTVVAVPPEWYPKLRECWQHVVIVDVAARTPRIANQASNALAWFGTGGGFFRSVMVP